MSRADHPAEQPNWPGNVIDWVMWRADVRSFWLLYRAAFRRLDEGLPPMEIRPRLYDWERDGD